ncbi:general substrate transporter [Aspergillus pseudodeflectus]|uniref:General substrate transporter n=1 Tax=Aspergillus pseudodeflectus TaxID=176178 RepID=A0ABR4K4Z9_9EURO
MGEGKEINIPDVQHLEEVVTRLEDKSGFRDLLHEVSLHPFVFVIALVVNLSNFMYGFDNFALSICLSIPAFQMKFGEPVELAPGVIYYNIPAYWQSLWNALAQVSTAIGAFIIPLVSDGLGRRYALGLSGAVCCAGVAVLYTCQTPGVFLAGKMVNAVGLGMSLTTSQTYVAEITPLKLRGFLLALQSFTLSLGVFVAVLVGYSKVNEPTEDSYRSLFAAAWAVPGLLVIIAFLIPESPLLQIQKNNVGKARNSLRKLHRKGKDIDALLNNAIRIRQEEQEMERVSQNMTYHECFRGSNARRMRLVLYLNGMNQLLGSAFASNSAYFLVSAGMSTDDISLVMRLGLGLGLGTTIINLFLMAKTRRRTLLLGGTTVCILCYLPMGIAGCFPGNSKALWAVGILMQIASIIGVVPTYGPAMSVAAEIPQLRLKSKSLAIGFFFNYLFSAVWNTAVPYMFNRDEGNLGGKTGFIFAAASLIMLAIVWLEIPETKDISYVHLDYLFQNKVPARRFMATARELQAGVTTSGANGM